MDGNNGIRALFFDVDGTLVSFRTHRVPASARAALDQAHRLGVRIFIATGRTVGDLDVLEGIPYDGVAGLNGADCRLRDGTVVARHPISRADFERALALAAELDFPVGLEFDGGLFVDRVTPVVEELARMVAHPVPERADLRALFASEACCQLCFYCDPATEGRAMAQLPSLVASRWCPHLADVNVRGVDKAAGLAAFAGRFGFRADEAMAFGDGGNDTAMLRAVGVGVAMGDAGPEVRAAADFVTAAVDADGVRLALERFGVLRPSAAPERDCGPASGRAADRMAGGIGCGRRGR